jgi:hypothetical protein
MEQLAVMRASFVAPPEVVKFSSQMRKAAKAVTLGFHGRDPATAR